METYSGLKFLIADFTLWNLMILKFLDQNVLLKLLILNI